MHISAYNTKEGQDEMLGCGCGMMGCTHSKNDFDHKEMYRMMYGNGFNDEQMHQQMHQHKSNWNWFTGFFIGG